MMTDTIYAKATGMGASGVAIIRISGGKSLAVLQKLTQKDNFEPRKMYYQKLIDEDGSILDDAMVVYFSQGQSYTGEESAELHIHGSYATVNALYNYLKQQDGLRIADAGEFTRRAFENGKMDLLEVEALADLIHAQTDFQRKQALSQLKGEPSKIYNAWREKLIQSLAWYEAHLDFSDEDIPEQLDEMVINNIDAMLAEIQRHLNDDRRGEVLRSGIKIAIVGAPNAGKSSLLNYLIGEDFAIVSDIAGTTRDVVEKVLDFRSFPIIISDTAGIHDASDSIEKIGIEKSYDTAYDADLLLVLFDGEKSLDNHSLDLLNNTSEKMVLITKKDSQNFVTKKIQDINAIDISIYDEQSMHDFLNSLEDKLTKICSKGEDSIITKARHRQVLENITLCLSRFLAQNDAVLKAEDLRLAISNLSKLVGYIGVEELLDVIFSDFCIGK